MEARRPCGTASLRRHIPDMIPYKTPKSGWHKTCELSIFTSPEVGGLGGTTPWRHGAHEARRRFADVGNTDTDMERGIRHCVLLSAKADIFFQLGTLVPRKGALRPMVSECAPDRSPRTYTVGRAGPIRCIKTTMKSARCDTGGDARCRQYCSARFDRL